LLDSPGAGMLFPQPLLATGELMDQQHGCGWRLVGDGSLALPAAPGLTTINLAAAPEAQGVVQAWMKRHPCHAALVRPDHYVFGTAADAASLAQLVAVWHRTARSHDRGPSPEKTKETHL
jgi:3-(3-hydroxy-phenyl)propionate hydroxylase